jgi:hypothetical protein
MNMIYRKVKKQLKKRFILNLIRSLHPIKTNSELIRFGGDGDGGYLIPNDLTNIEACFSPGVGDISEFEIQCAEMGMKVFMADASVEPPILPYKEMVFIKKFIGNNNNNNFISMEKWINSTTINKNSDLILQMDIEGHEFDAINSIPLILLKRFRIINIEFHSLQNLSKKKYYFEARKTFKKLLKNHKCVHIHPNNCCGIKTKEGIEYPVVAEFTFYRKDRIKFSQKANLFPHPLDEENTLNAPIALPKVWYSN